MALAGCSYLFATVIFYIVPLCANVKIHTEDSYTGRVIEQYRLLNPEDIESIFNITKMEASRIIVKINN